MAEGGFAPISSWGGNTPATNPALADLLNRGWTNSGQSFNIPLAGNWLSVPFNQTYGGQPAPYADLSAQILDAMQTPGRYAQSWPWNNGAPRYNFAKGGQGMAPLPPGLGGGGPPSTGGGLPTPGASAPPGGGLPPPGSPPPGAGTPPPGNWTATGGPPNSNGVYPAAPPRPPGFGPVPPNTPPQVQTPINQQPVTDRFNPADALARWNSLQSQDARDAYMLGNNSREHNALLRGGQYGQGDLNSAANKWGGYAGVDRETGRPWVSYDGQTRTYL